jgi:hypothetical protein
MRHAGCQVRLIEVGQPGGVIVAGGMVERPLGAGESHAAGAYVIAGGVPVCFYHQPFGEQGR